jgi:hypothetical protein
VVGTAGLLRFIVADLSEPRAVQQELQAIVPVFQSVPAIPIQSRGSRDLSRFAVLARWPNVAQPTLCCDNADDLPAPLDREVVPRAEALREVLRPACAQLITACRTKVHCDCPLSASRILAMALPAAHQRSSRRRPTTRGSDDDQRGRELDNARLRQQQGQLGDDVGVCPPEAARVRQRTSSARRR